MQVFKGDGPLKKLVGNHGEGIYIHLQVQRRYNEQHRWLAFRELADAGQLHRRPSMSGRCCYEEIAREFTHSHTLQIAECTLSIDSGFYNDS